MRSRVSLFAAVLCLAAIAPPIESARAAPPPDPSVSALPVAPRLAALPAPALVAVDIGFAVDSCAPAIAAIERTPVPRFVSVDRATVRADSSRSLRERPPNVTTDPVHGAYAARRTIT